HNAVNAIGISRRDRYADAPQAFRREAVAGDLAPRAAAVSALVESTARPVRRRIDVPWRTPSLPQGGIDRLRIVRVHRKINRAGLVVFEQHLLPGTASVRGAKHAALRISGVCVAKRRN